MCGDRTCVRCRPVRPTGDGRVLGGVKLDSQHCNGYDWYMTSCIPKDRHTLQRFGEAIDAIRERTEAQIGKEDVSYIRRMNVFSRAMEIAGRTLIHFSFEPLGFGAGVFALWLHKILQAGEIGHAALHGAFDKLEGAEAFRSTTFSWDTPIDEESWRYGHNVRHHQYTNIAGKDPDIHFGFVRLTENTDRYGESALDLPLTLLFSIPNF